MPRIVFSLCLLLLIAGCGRDNETETAPAPAPEAEALTQPVTVRAYLADQVPEGFRGDVHPLLDRSTSVDVTAEWSLIGTGRGLRLGYFPEMFYGPFRKLQVAEARRTYSASHFSAFLPGDEDLETVGRTWTVDLEKVADFLSQFHPGISMHVRSTGRRAGPDGGFAVLRAASSSHAEIAFRVHAEYDLEPGIFYTPAHFSGRLVVNKEQGTIEHFEMGVPSDRTLNVTLSVILPAEALVEIVHVDRMELRSVRDEPQTGIAWTEAMDSDEAVRKLKRAFFGFLEIDWVPPQEALALAREKQKPIMAVVLWGSIDDQSC